MDKIELAKWLHDNYEEVAKEQNWNTQENCKVEFDTLPDANKQTMIKIAERLLNFDLLHLHIVSNCTDLEPDFIEALNQLIDTQRKPTKKRF